MLTSRIFRILWISALFFVLSLAPMDKVFSASNENSVNVSVEVVSVLAFSLDAASNQLSGLTNTADSLVILEKTSAGEEIYHPAWEKVFFNPLSTYTLVSEI